MRQISQRAGGSLERGIAKSATASRRRLFCWLDCAAAGHRILLSRLTAHQLTSQTIRSNMDPLYVQILLIIIAVLFLGILTGMVICAMGNTSPVEACCGWYLNRHPRRRVHRAIGPNGEVVEVEEESDDLYDGPPLDPVSRSKEKREPLSYELEWAEQAAAQPPQRQPSPDYVDHHQDHGSYHTDQGSSSHGSSRHGSGPSRQGSIPVRHGSSGSSGSGSAHGAHGHH